MSAIIGPDVVCAWRCGQMKGTSDGFQLIGLASISLRRRCPSRPACQLLGGPLGGDKGGDLGDAEEGCEGRGNGAAEGRPKVVRELWGGFDRVLC